MILSIPSASHAQVAVGVSIRVGPPPLPVYVQPPLPAPGYIWAPGYWAYGPAGYFWVPGTWILPPTAGLLWTPGYWGWGGGVYLWHGGYWGPHVGFYGGINYGFGYTGVGFAGGYWRGGVYNYNRAVTNVNVNVVHNTYNTTVVNNTATANRVSYNGGTGGTAAHPTSSELAAARETHSPATPLQAQHAQAASTNHALLASVNHGRPAVAASARPGVFEGPGVVAARSANPNRPHAGQSNAANRPVPQNNRPAGAQNPNQTQHPANTAQQKPAHPNQPRSNRPPESERHPNSPHPGDRPGR
jgi:hypothetical protein